MSLKQFTATARKIENLLSGMEEPDCGAAQQTLLAGKLLECIDSLQNTVSEFSIQTNGTQSLAYFQTYRMTMTRVEKVAISMYNTSLLQGSLVNVITALHLQSKAFELTEETRETAEVFAKPNMQ